MNNDELQHANCELQDQIVALLNACRQAYATILSNTPDRRFTLDYLEHAMENSLPAEEWRTMQAEIRIRRHSAGHGEDASLKYLIACNFQGARLFASDPLEWETPELQISASIVRAKQVAAVDVQSITAELKAAHPSVEWFPTDLEGTPLEFLSCATALQAEVLALMAAADVTVRRVAA